MYTRTLAALAVSAAFIQSASAAEVEFTLSHWVPATHALQVTGMEPWAESIKQASNGRIEINIFPASQLGAAGDHYDMARDGIVDIGFINPGYQPGRFPIMAAAEIPFLFANAEGGIRALTEWYDQYAEQEMGDTYFCMAISHDPGTIHSKAPVIVPEDIKGKAVRPANATEARFVSMLGGTSVQVPAGEMREVLARGTADMTQSPWQSLYTFGAVDVVQHHLDMPFYFSINAFIFNKAKVDGLAAEDRKVIDDHCSPEWAQKIAAGWTAAESAGRDKIAADSTHTLHKPTPEQVQLWKDAVVPLADEWRATVNGKGLDAEAIMTSLVETLKKYDSLAD
jgi:TRAP-type C4-dicarboxylate transport system substrate-binding protein